MRADQGHSEKCGLDFKKSLNMCMSMHVCVL